MVAEGPIMSVEDFINRCGLSEPPPPPAEATPASSAQLDLAFLTKHPWLADKVEADTEGKALGKGGTDASCGSGSEESTACLGR